MLSIQWCAVALSAATTVNAYLDTSPFSLFSTNEFFKSDRTLAGAQTITSEVSNKLSSCPSDHYIIVSQPGVSAVDYKSIKRASALRSGIKSTISIPDVVGTIDTQQWERILWEQCGAEVLHIDASTGSIPSYQMMPKVISLSFAPPSEGNQKQALVENEAFFASLMEPLLRTNYTVLWTTTPADTVEEPSREYNMDADTQDSLHMGLKRDMGAGLQRRANNVTLVDGPLFHRYQFFTPGIFMGFMVGFILLLLLYVGISALASVQVTYAAFDKEQGALAKTKVQ